MYARLVQQEADPEMPKDEQAELVDQLKAKWDDVNARRVPNIFVLCRGNEVNCAENAWQCCIRLHCEDCIFFSERRRGDIGNKCEVC